DEDVINLRRVRAAVIAGWIKRADLAGEVSLKTTDAGEQTSEREKKTEVERHQKMSGRHEKRADGDGPGSSEDAIGDQAASDRCEINETGVETEDRRGERLHREWPPNALDQVAKRAEPGDVLDVSGVQQSVDHVEHEQRLHAVVGKAFPGLGEGDIAETARMPDEAAIREVVLG